MNDEHTPTEAGQPRVPETPDRSGTRRSADAVIGPYRLLEKIGEGGMGEVHLAQQSEPIKRRVALKLIKPGMGSKEVIARFEAERQALALMNHPCVAKVLDAGTTEAGQPYFVMEYVAGLPINEYCDRHGLDMRRRLELFVSVCQGVQHAHQKAIIHRDLKPSNVLVTEVDGKPVAKIIDFGVAKATAQKLTEQTMFTELGQFIGTPEYMSPEQADLSAEDIDTRSDIYSLGVMLYELLSGSLPFESQTLRKAGFDEIRRIIREQDPPRPSQRLATAGDRAQNIARHRATQPARLLRQLRGDLDWIVLKALEKERSRRYETANGLAADIGRFLRDEPVVAGPPSASYRLRKLVRRNRAAFQALAAIFLILMLGIAGSGWGFLRARQAERLAAREAAEAKRQAEIAQAVNDFLNQDLLAAVQPSAQSGRGIDVRMREVLDVAAQRIEAASAEGGRFADKPLVEAAIRNTLGSTYLQLGKYGEAETQYQREVDLRMRGRTEPDLMAGWAISHLAYSKFRQGRPEEAEQDLLRALAYESRAARPELGDVSDWKSSLATVYEDQGRFAEAESLFLDALAYQREALGSEDTRTTRSMVNLANLYQRIGRYDRCEALGKEVLEIFRRTLGEDDPSTLSVLNNLGNVIANQGRMKEAELYMSQALEAKRRIMGPDNPVTLNSMNNVAEVNGVLGKWREAAALHRETWERRVAVLGADHPRTLSSRVLYAKTLALGGDAQAALPIIEEALADTRRVRGPEHPDTHTAESILGTVLMKAGRYKEAETSLRSLVARMERTDNEEGSLELAQVRLAMSLLRQGRREESTRRLTEFLPALPVYEKENEQMAEEAGDSLELWNRADPRPAYAEGIRTIQTFLSGRAPDPDS